MTHEQAAFLAAQNRHHRYMGFGKKQRYIEVFQCSGEDMNNVLIGPQQSSLAMAAQALAGGANHGTAAMNTGGGLLGSGNPSAIAASAVKSPNPSTGLLPPGMLNSLQNHPSSIISNSLVGNQLAAFPNSQPPPPPTPPTAPAPRRRRLHRSRTNLTTRRSRLGRRPRIREGARPRSRCGSA